jgi:hypothetical protein
MTTTLQISSFAVFLMTNISKICAELVPYEYAVVSEDEEVKIVSEENKLSVSSEEEKKVNIKIIAASNTPIEEDEEAEYKELMEELEKALEQQAASGNTFEDNEGFLPGSSWGLQAGNSNSYLV